MFSRKFVLLAVVSLVAAPAARADVKLHPLFTDNMVLQRGVKIPVWGLAEPGEGVGVQLAKRDGTTHGPVVAKADEKGMWKAELPAIEAGEGFVLSVKGDKSIEKLITLNNVAVGEVWVCSGQSNMEWSVNASGESEKVKAGAKNPSLRLFTVQKRTATAPISDQNDLKHFTKWSECDGSTVAGFSAVAFHFGQNLQKSLKVPVGLIHTSWGGTPAEAWTSDEALAAVPELKYYTDSAKRAAGGKQPVGPGTPSSLYNAMIHPLLPYAIKGAIWYQGESNAGKAFEYRTLFTTMIEDWRKKWGSDFPFLCVQLAPWHANDANGVSWAELREAQLLATKKLKNVGMAVITDVGDLYDIHPKDKLTVGNRLAAAAKGLVYGEKVVPSGPVYKEMTVEGEKAILSFDYVGSGLQARYQTLNGFESCGEDKVFYPAKAFIAGETVVVTSDKVTKPVAVRFGWKNYPIVNLFNRDGLPATPFRTDDFALTTMPQAKEVK